jgi:hypothetical protein
MLGLCVESSGWLVEDRQQRLFAHQRPAEGQLLPLSATEVDSAAGRSQLGLLPDLGPGQEPASRGPVSP